MLTCRFCCFSRVQGGKSCRCKVQLVPGPCVHWGGAVPGPAPSARCHLGGRPVGTSCSGARGARGSPCAASAGSRGAGGCRRAARGACGVLQGGDRGQGWCHGKAQPRPCRQRGGAEQRCPGARCPQHSAPWRSGAGCRQLPGPCPAAPAAGAPEPGVGTEGKRSERLEWWQERQGVGAGPERCGDTGISTSFSVSPGNSAFCSRFLVPQQPQHSQSTACHEGL